MLGLLIDNSLILLLLRINLIQSCNKFNPIDIQSAAYSYPIILRVQPTKINHEILSSKNQYYVIIKEIIKMKSNTRIHLQVNNIIPIFVAPTIIDHDHNKNCWKLLKIVHSNFIIFLNWISSPTNPDNFEILHPPIESTIRVRAHIQRVTCDSCETYSPQLIVKTLPDKPEIFKPYRLQCNTRGNPLPKLVWSKNTRQFRSSKACSSKKCHIFSIQKRYKSFLYFRKLSIKDAGVYTCHAKNSMNKTQASITLAFDPVHKNPLEHYSKRKNSTCDFLDRCYDRGQCIILEKKLQCLCEKNFFGDRCEHSYDEMVKKHSNELLLFKSRFITSVMLGIVLVLLMTLGLISWLLSRAGKRHFKSQKTVSDIETVKDKKKDEDVVKNVNHIVEPPSSALLKNSTSIDNKLTANIQPKTIASVLPVPTEPNIVPDRTENKTLKINAFVPNNVKSVLPSSSQKPVLLNKSYFTDTSTNDEEDGDDFNDYDPDAILKRARTFSSQKETPIDEYEERFSFKMNNSEIHGLSNDIVLAEDYHYCLDDNGLIKPLESSSSRRMMIQPPPTRFTKYVSSRFVLPTPVNRN